MKLSNKFTKLPWKYRASGTPEESLPSLAYGDCILKTSFFPFHPQVDKAVISPFISREFRVIFSIHGKYLVGKFPTDTITGNKLRLVSFKYN